MIAVSRRRSIALPLRAGSWSWSVTGTRLPNLGDFAANIALQHHATAFVSGWVNRDWAGRAGGPAMSACPVSDGRPKKAACRDGPSADTAPCRILFAIMSSKQH